MNTLIMILDKLGTCSKKKYVIMFRELRDNGSEWSEKSLESLDTWLLVFFWTLTCLLLVSRAFSALHTNIATGNRTFELFSLKFKINQQLVIYTKKYLYIGNCEADFHLKKKCFCQFWVACSSIKVKSYVWLWVYLYMVVCN